MRTHTGLDEGDRAEEVIGDMLVAVDGASLGDNGQPRTSAATATGLAAGARASTAYDASMDDDMLDITTDARRDITDLVDRSQGSKNLMDDPLVEDSSSRTHYDDFHTIDWLKDLARGMLSYYFLIYSSFIGITDVYIFIDYYLYNIQP